MICKPKLAPKLCSFISYRSISRTSLQLKIDFSRLEDLSQIVTIRPIPCLKNMTKPSTSQQKVWQNPFQTLLSITHHGTWHFHQVALPYRYHSKTSFKLQIMKFPYLAKLKASSRSPDRSVIGISYQQQTKHVYKVKGQRKSATFSLDYPNASSCVVVFHHVTRGVAVTWCRRKKRSR